MKRLTVAAAAVLLVPLAGSALATSGSSAYAQVEGLRAVAADTGAQLRWAPVKEAVRVFRDGRLVAEVRRGAGGYLDTAAGPGAVHHYDAYRVSKRGKGGSGASVRMPSYLVGAASRDITPSGVVNLGGNGIGDGRLIPDAVAGRGGTGKAENERIRTRAWVVDDGKHAVAIATIEAQGWFAAYQDGKAGLSDMAAEVARLVPRLPASSIVIASDHSHSAPDTLGAWGGPAPGYLDHVKRQVVAAVVDAYRTRVFAELRAGHSDASDLVYNQSCTEGLNQSEEPAYPGPDACATPGKDGLVRALQATSPSGRHPLTFMAFAAHATAGGAAGIHGDWPQYLSDAMTQQYGGQGIAMVGALGGTQPCRTACAFTNKSNPGYGVKDRKTALVLNYGAHVRAALRTAKPVTGPVLAAQGFIREPIVGPAVTALFTAGSYAGAGLLRSHEPPWVNAQTIRTVVGVVRIGGVVLNGTPGEGFPRIRQDLEDALGAQAQEVIQLGLANDQLGYLIAPAAYVPVIAAQVPVNDNIIFNVSPTVGDHVACAGIALAGQLRLTPRAPATCAPYQVLDSAGDPIGEVPVGGIVVPAG